MKFIALAAAAASLVFTASVGARASIPSQAAAAHGTRQLTFSALVPSLHGLTMHHVLVPLQTGATATATTQTTTVPTLEPTEVVTPTAQPTSTKPGSNFPDPVTLLNNALTILERITQIHFEYLYVGDQTNVEHISIDAKGMANCTSELATVSALDSIPGTSEKKTQHYEFIQKGKKYYKKELKGAHKTWQAAKAKDVAALGAFTLDNPLFCTPATTSGGSGGTSTLKDLVNHGSATYHGFKTWHLTATEVTTDAQGNTQETQLDFYISQDHFLLNGYRATILDPVNSVKLVFEQILTLFGKKVSIPTPRVGSTTP